MKGRARSQMPQVAVLLESSQGVSREMLHGILAYVRVYGPWSLNIAGGGTNDLHLPDLRHWKGTGIIGRVTTESLARDILASKLPAVLFNPGDAYLAPTHPLSKCSRTHCDSRAIGRLAADYYLDKAFQHFAYVGETTKANWSLGRQESYAARLAETGRACHIYQLPAPMASDWDTERPSLCKWLRKLPKPVAIFAANDNRARQVLDACLVAEIAVPYEAAVLGVNNDILICETCIPALSSIAVDAQKAAHEAAHVLDSLMRRTVTRQQIITYGPAGVISRASTDTLHVDDKLVIRALEFIRINSGLMIRVSDVAEHLGVTSRWVELRFQQTLGQSIHATIQRTRMATVCAMLKETGLSLGAISKKCGFSQPNHLCSLFRRHYGATMSDFRARHRAPAPH